MVELTEKDLEKNYEDLLGWIKKYISSPRKEKLLQLYKDKEEIIALAPAAGKENYHSCYPGGYVVHILNVLNMGLKVNQLWVDEGAQNTHTEEELIFALLNHDLGKVGEGDQPYFVPNPSEWHRKNQGAIYTHNPKINFMPVPDRSLFILQQYGIECSFNEFVSIKIHDGLYDEGNKAYLMSFSEDGKLRTNLPFIVHQTDMLASRIEYQQWKSKADPHASKTSNNGVRGNSSVKKRMTVLTPKNESLAPSSSASKLFEEMFKD